MRQRHTTRRINLDTTMLISERHVRDWADLRDAEGELPLLVRRLIGRVATVTALAMPGGDAVNSPGWDGEVMAETGNAWVPPGRSCWEMGRDSVPATKAAEDYRKRTAETPADARRNTTFVFVTPRRWNNKDAWRTDAEAKAEWRAVRVYDARDLENWLEETSAVALWFADLRGIAGPGVEAVEAAWRHWAEQSVPPITLPAFLAGRADFAAGLAAKLQTGDRQIVIAADSQEEAVAFTAAIILGAETLRSKALVVTEPSGWRFVDANPDITLAIAANDETAHAATPKPARLLVLAKAAGGFVSAPEHHDAERLPRPERSVFQNALVELGLDPADAERAARQCGRSWAVWRRLNAANPAIRRPAWLDRPEAHVLATACLVGAWLEDRETDRVIVAELAGRDYAAVTADLRALACLDDPPVLRIGPAWKAKAPLELLHLWGAHLTAEDIERFLGCLLSILEAPDPVLDLDPNKRWMASVYGKARRESGALIESLLDSLVMLAARGAELPGLHHLDLQARASRLVSSLLKDGDRIRWLSVSGFLSKLAEAAPDAYLIAVDAGLRVNDSPVIAIIAETGATSGMTGHCWHGDLLRSLERLAWAPQRLGQIADILARLTRAPKPGNWGNTPQNSLLSLFRSWYPQTNAQLSTRLTVLDRVVHDHREAGWHLLIGLGLQQLSFASPNDTPNWRTTTRARSGTRMIRKFTSVWTMCISS